MSFVKNNGGSGEEANDIFQEGMVSLFINIKKGTYESTKSTKLTTYLFQICKYKWYDTLKGGNKKYGAPIESDFDSEIDIHKNLEREEKYNQLAALLDKLDQSCKKLLNLFYYQQKKMEEIGEMLGLDTKSAKNAKYRCMQKLKSLAKQ